MKIETESTGIIFAVCQDCDWDDAMNINEKNRMNKLRNRIYAHVRETGHEVVLETGNAFYYRPKKINRTQ